MAKVDLSQAQATVLEMLLVEGPWTKWVLNAATVKALKKRAYVEEVSDGYAPASIQITILGIDTLREFPYADMHTEIIVDATADHAMWLQKVDEHPENTYWHDHYIELAEGAMLTAHHRVSVLAKVNMALIKAVLDPPVKSNGQPPSEPTPKKPAKTPVKPKPVKVEHNIRTAFEAQEG